MTRSLLLVLAIAPALAAQAPGSAIPPGAERAYGALEQRVDGELAMDLVRFMDRYWRISGNPGFNASVDRIRDEAARAGLAVRVEEFAARSRGWDYEIGTVAFADTGEVLLSRERDRVSLCINSFSTPDGGVDAPIVDVGAATPADFAGKDVKGAVILGRAPVQQLWQQGVKSRGALGVISTAIASYIRPDDPAQFTFPDQWDVFQWGSVPYDADAKAFGFKAGVRVAERIRARLKTGPVRVKVNVQSSFYDGPSRMVVAEIPGTIAPAERIVMVAHIQEPGANDDASGCGTLLAMAVALQKAIAAKRLPPPGRTLTFIWGDENRASRAWLAAQPERARGVQYMFSLDMTGEDTAKTGGTFLIEKQADPAAVWARPSDPHTAWGAGEVKASELKGSLLNDVHLAICRRRARDTGWTVKTNPYEGGSDHTEFKNAGIPSLLDWHFTDRFYHTNFDRPDKTSPAEMVNVGVSVATSAWFLASATEQDALAAVRLIGEAASARLALERSQAATSEILEAWRKWYGEALDSVRRLKPGEPSSAVDAAVAAARTRLDADQARAPR
ncbi:MAG TPA: M28 family peptidase [Vicinamibacterales bacterium]|nr:M28 family peptidase [Vicinamibacterales bacterium]